MTGNDQIISCVDAVCVDTSLLSIHHGGSSHAGAQKVHSHLGRLAGEVDHFPGGTMGFEGLNHICKGLLAGHLAIP